MKKNPSASVKRVTRDVDTTAVGDLLDHAPRATLAFVEAEEVEVLPVRAGMSEGVHIFAVPTAGAPDLRDREVVLVRDDGPYWFQLRGITVRGIAKRGVAPIGESGQHLIRYSIEPRRVLAWDYGRLRGSGGGPDR
jgi:hypothetical protein